MYLVADAALYATAEEHSVRFLAAVPASDGGSAAGDGAAHEIAARPPLPASLMRWRSAGRRRRRSRDGSAAGGGGVGHEMVARPPASASLTR